MVGASSNFRHHDFPTLFFPFQFHFSLCCVCGTFPLPPPFSLHPLCQIISARLYSPPLQSFLVTAAKGAPNECAEKDDALHCQMQNKEWKFFLSLSRVLSNIVDVIWRDPRRKKFRMLSPNSRIPYSNENVGMLVLLWRTSVYIHMNLPQPIIYLLLSFVYMVMSLILVLACCLCIGA